MAGLYNFSRFTALVLEDQAFIRTMVVRIMKQLEFGQVFEGTDGTDGLDIALDRKPNVIVCDIEMAPMDGLTFLGLLRRKEDPGQQTPVIFLTNHAHKDMVLKARELGVNAFIAKPVTVLGLREKLSVLLAGRR